MSNPAPERARRRPPVKPGKPARRGTPIRNTALLVILAVALAALVIVMPKQPVQNVATVLAPGGAAAGGEGAGVALTLRFSEVMASNGSAYPDDKGEYPDWVEIENTGDEPLSLEGVGLSDREDRILFLFPAMEIAPKSYVVVFCDDTNAADAGRALHARFKISALGETLYLFDRNSQVIESLTVPPLPSDTVYARVGNNWVQTEQFTPGFPNDEDGYNEFRSRALVSSSGLVLNELVASNVTTLKDEDGEYPDWIEIYNGGPLPIDLSNYALSDDVSRPVKWIFPKYTIQPGEYFVVFASGKNRPGGEDARPHTNFSLRAEGETVILSDRLGQPVDRVTYELLDKDVSWGRVPGLEHTWQEYKQPTPGMANDHKGEIEMDARMRAQNTTGVFISEVVTSSTGIETAYGNTSYDWIEIVNRGDEAVDLTGWGLSDSVNNPRQWRFPQVKLPPGGYVLVFASGLSASPTGSSALHTNFRLSALGETVVLAEPGGRIVDKLVVPRLETNNSYGRDFDRGGLFYYDTATAGAANTSEGFIGYAPTPQIDLKGGMYKRQAVVSVVAPAGVTVRYTLDGSIPTEDIGEVYEGPLTLTKKTTFRARGFVDGYKPSLIATETYLVNTYSTLPVICLTVDPVDLWHSDTGIYADGDKQDFSVTKMPYKDTTYKLMKTDRLMRARVGNFELFEADGTQKLNQTIDVQLNGEYSLDMPQKSFRITARPRYGEPTLKYPFFADRDNTEYQSIILRNGGNRGGWDRIADSLMARIVDWTDTDVWSMAYAPCTVYLNGEYWGIYDLRERFNKHTIAQREGWTDPEKIDFLRASNSGSGAALAGTNTNYKQLISYVKSHDLNDPEALKTVTDWVDIGIFFDWHIFEMYFANTDAGNQKFYRQRTTGEISKWKWVLYDLDYGLFQRNNNGCLVWLDPKGAGDQNFDNTLIRKLLEVPEMRDRFLRRYGELFQTLSDTERVLALIDQMVAEIDPEMGLHCDRWAGLYRETQNMEAFLRKDGNSMYNFWKIRINRLKNTVCGRPYFAWTETRDWFKLTDTQMIEYFGPCPAEIKEDKF